MSTDSELVEKNLPCEECGSSDAVARYTDNHRFCFSCSHYYPGDGAPTKGKGVSKKDPSETAAKIADLREGSDIRALPDWKLTQATCRTADYRVKVAGPGKGHHLATYTDEKGSPCFVKVRVVSPDNSKLDFFGVGDQDRVLLWGHETLGNGGKMVVVTEGEKDRLHGLQLWAGRFPVVGLPFGAESSGKAFARTLSKLNQYEQVILALDMDKQGRDGALELAAMLPPGKAYIAEFPEKDLAEVVIKRGPEEAKRCLHNAAPYRPGGVLDADEVDAQLDEAPQWGDSLPPEMEDLYLWTYGLMPGQVWVGGAGTSAGKSDWSAQIVAHHIKPVEDGGNGKRAALFNYESDSPDTLRTVLSKLWSKNFSIPDPEDGTPNVYWSPEDLAEARAYRREKCGKLFINDHKGIINWEATEERIRYLFFAYGVTLHVVDPVAALVANAPDKNAALDQLFARAKGLAEELGITILFWSHLTRPSSDQKNHEEGGQVRTSQFRGSNSISMWADVVFGIERNQQAEDEEERCTAICRTLKVRKAGRNTGKTFAVVYNVMSGVLDRKVYTPQETTQQDEAEPQPPEE